MIRVGPETSSRTRDDSNVPPSAACNPNSDCCRSCLRPLAGNRTPPSPSIVSTRRVAPPPRAAAAAAVLPGGEEGTLAEVPRLQKNAALGNPVDVSVPREDLFCGVGLGKAGGAEETVALAAREGWARRGAGSAGGEEVRAVRKAVGVVVPSDENGVEKGSLNPGGGCPVEEVSGHTRRRDAHTACSSSCSSSCSGGGGSAVGGAVAVAGVEADVFCSAPTAATGLPYAGTAEALSKKESATLVVAQGVATEDASKAPTTSRNAGGTPPISGGKTGGRILPAGEPGLAPMSGGGEERQGGDGGDGEPVFPPPPAVPSASDETCDVRSGGGGVACHEPEVTVAAAPIDD